ncbi:hypothetical protein N7523_005599 [Penicillium sp. IBT 18751x]|nr:hypothetical protein N7523_005809 [Penicillium sp. IBT 18751x]KAJ6117848.1 hypothetical protein N7523_005599 [Penicillium sp. IBT 18751x]
MRNPDDLQYLFGRVFGDPSHCTGCIWVGCPNSVSKEARNNATILLKVQRRSKIDTIERIVSTATKYMLCKNCSGDRSRLVTSAESLMDMLLVYALRTDDMNLSPCTQYWPTSMCQNAVQSHDMRIRKRIDTEGLSEQTAS